MCGFVAILYDGRVELEQVTKASVRLPGSAQARMGAVVNWLSAWIWPDYHEASNRILLCPRPVNWEKYRVLVGCPWITWQPDGVSRTVGPLLKSDGN